VDENGLKLSTGGAAVKNENEADDEADVSDANGENTTGAGASAPTGAAATKGTEGLADATKFTHGALDVARCLIFV
jgi:hypothetical protein